MCTKDINQDFTGIHSWIFKSLIAATATATASAANTNMDLLHHSAATTAICGVILKVAHHIKRNLAKR